MAIIPFARLDELTGSIADAEAAAAAAAQSAIEAAESAQDAEDTAATIGTAVSDAQAAQAAAEVAQASAETAETNAETAETNAETAQAAAETARDFAHDWSSAAEDTPVNDGVNPSGFSAFHWSEKAEATAAGIGALDSLSDVDTSGVSDGDVLTYDSGSGDWLPAPSGSGGTLAGLTDVNLTSPADGAYLRYDNGTSKWIDQAFPTLVTAIDGLSDVTITTPSDGDVLTWHAGSSQWIDATPVTGVTTLAALTDVDIPSPNDGEVLTFDSGSGDWISSPSSGGVGEPIVILATGQSNSYLIKAFSWDPPANLNIWNFDYTTGTLGTAFAPADNTNINVMWSMAAQVARDNPLSQVYLVNIGPATGQSITHWMTGTGAPDVYDMSKDNIEAALLDIGLDHIDMFAWWQGENDSAALTTYVADFETVMGRYKGETWFPASTPITVFGVASATQRSDPNYQTLNNVLQACVARDATKRRYIYSSDFVGATYWDDSTHMSALGYYENGKVAGRPDKYQVVPGLVVDREVPTDPYMPYAIKVQVAGNTARFINRDQTVSAQVARFEGAKPSSITDNNSAHISFFLNDDSVTATEFARLTWIASDVNVGTGLDGTLQFAIQVAGSLTDKMYMSTLGLYPGQNDGMALGISGNAWSDLYLASGSIVNFAAGNITVTQSSGVLTFNSTTLSGLADPASAQDAATKAYVDASARITPNSQSTAYTAVLADANKSILHPISDTNNRTFTIPANGSVAYPVGTTLTFINEVNTVTIAINTDTLVLAGAGTTGSRTLAANGIATATKLTSTKWFITGAGLT